MRARQPDLVGTVEVDGVTITYETFGDAGPAIVLMPTWCVVDSRAWKLQVPYLSRHFRVVTWDGPGNGGSSRPVKPDAYSAQAHVRYALAVLDAVAIDRATAVASSGGTHRTLLLAADHPERIEAVAFVGPRTHLVEDAPGEVATAFATGDLERFLGAFMAAAFSEPHSTKAIEDGIGWGHGTTMEILRAAREADRPSDLDAYRSMCERIDQPVLIVQGADDRLSPSTTGGAWPRRSVTTPGWSSSRAAGIAPTCAIPSGSRCCSRLRPLHDREGTGSTAVGSLDGEAAPDALPFLADRPRSRSS